MSIGAYAHSSLFNTYIYLLFVIRRLQEKGINRSPQSRQQRFKNVIGYRTRLALRKMGKYTFHDECEVYQQKHADVKSRSRHRLLLQPELPPAAPVPPAKCQH